jgi:PAS domain S-box-containing protein
VAVISFTPLLGAFISNYIGFRGFAVSNSYNDQVGKAFFEIWLTLGIAAAIITGAISYIDYYVKREISTPLVGMILVFIGLIDAFELLIANKVIFVKLDYISSIYATWLASRIVFSVLLAFSTFYFIFIDKRVLRGMPKKNGMLIRAGVIYLLATAATIACFLIFDPAFLDSKFNNVLNFEAIPIGVLLLWALLILPYFHLRFPSIFSRMLVLSAIPGLCAELAMCLHVQPFDTFFNIAYFLRFFSYVIPLAGISMNYIETITKEKNIVYRLDSEIHERLAAQKQLEKREALLANAERIAHMGSWEYNTLTDELKWSDEMYKIHGYEQGSINPTMGLQDELILPGYSKEIKDTFNTAIRNRSAYNIEYQVKRPTGEVRFLLGQGNYLRSSNKLVGTVLDITELKEAQNNLEIKVRELNRSNNELEQFAYVASHDLQEPLRKIKAFGDKLSSKYAPALPEEGVDYLSRMTNAAVRMQTLIADLLTFSKVSQTNENVQQVELKGLVNGVTADLEAVIEKKNAQIVADLNQSVIGIPSQIRQLFQNLISNAVKFSKPGVPPVVRLSAQPADSNELKMHAEAQINTHYCKITVADNGIGFDEQYSQKVFILFERLHTRNEYEGTGIGLAICKKIVENHNGYISVHSKEGEGTVFTIFLPLHNSPKQ